MAYREVTRVETKEVLRQWVGGACCKRISARLGLDVTKPAACGEGRGIRPRQRPSNTNLGSLRNGRREEIGHLADAGRNETAFWPDEAYISDIAHKFLEDRNDIGMPEFISKGNLGEHANSNTGQNGGPDRFDTVGREIPLNRHAESTFLPHKRPIRRLC